MLCKRKDMFLQIECEMEFFMIREPGARAVGIIGEGIWDY